MFFVVVVNCLHFITLSLYYDYYYSLYVGQETNILSIFCVFHKWKIDYFSFTKTLMTHVSGQSVFWCSTERATGPELWPIPLAAVVLVVCLLKLRVVCSACMIKYFYFFLLSSYLSWVSCRRQSLTSWQWMGPSPVPPPSLLWPEAPVRKHPWKMSAGRVWGEIICNPLSLSLSLSLSVPQCWISRYSSWRCSSSPWSISICTVEPTTTFRPRFRTTTRMTPKSPWRRRWWSTTSETEVTEEWSLLPREERAALWTLLLFIPFTQHNICIDLVQKITFH